MTALRWLLFRRRGYTKCTLALIIGVVASMYWMTYQLNFDLTKTTTTTTTTTTKTTTTTTTTTALTTTKAVPLKNVTVLTWTKFFGTNMCNSFNDFTQKWCPHYGCRAIDDKRREAEVDAILFHVHPTDIRAELPQRRQPHQYYVFHLMESPLYSAAANLQRFGGYFNLTMSYRIDSDIECGYLEFRKRPPPTSEETLQASMPPPPVLSPTEIRARVARKSKLAAWFVSHCGANSGRKEVVDELNKYISVDIYGHCGPLECTRRTEQQCDEMLGSDYKFYMAFENSACVDYVTEKFLRLRHFVVPLVLRASDYRNVAPPSTFIAVDQFPSIKHLAEHLIYLDNNVDAYIKYFEWQETMSVAPAMGFCDLCFKLATGRLPKHTVYEDLHGWWRDKAECASGIGKQLAQNGEEDTVDTIRTQ